MNTLAPTCMAILAVSQFFAAQADLPKLQQDIDPVAYRSKQQCLLSDDFRFWADAGDKPYCYMLQGTDEWRILTDASWFTEFVPPERLLPAGGGR